MPDVAQMLRRMIRSTGFDVVRVPATHPASAATADSANGVPPGSTRNCFPGDPTFAPYNPWPIPRDLESNQTPWARTLLRLYRERGSWPACVSPEVGMFIHAFVRNLRPRIVVETGTCHAASTIWIAAALAINDEAAKPGTPSTIHTFDDFSLPSNPAISGLPLYTQREQLVRERLKEAGVADRVIIHKGDSSRSIIAQREALDRAGGVQLAFIDGDHSPEGAQRDLEAVEPSLNVGGFILLHDVWPTICGCTGPRWIADNIRSVATGRYQVCDFYTAPLNYGLTILRRLA